MTTTIMSSIRLKPAEPGRRETMRFDMCAVPDCLGLAQLNPGQTIDRGVGERDLLHSARSSPLRDRNVLADEECGVLFGVHHRQCAGFIGQYADGRRVFVIDEGAVERGG